MKPASEVNESVIKAWKEQYGSVGKITVKEGEDKKVAFVRKPTNKEIDFASANLTRGALTQYGISLFKTCQIGGDVITSEDALRTVGKYMNEMIEEAEAEFEKL